MTPNGRTAQLISCGKRIDWMKMLEPDRDHDAAQPWLRAGARVRLSHMKSILTANSITVQTQESRRWRPWQDRSSPNSRRGPPPDPCAPQTEPRYASTLLELSMKAKKKPMDEKNTRRLWRRHHRDLRPHHSRSDRTVRCAQAGEEGLTRDVDASGFVETQSCLGSHFRPAVRSSRSAVRDTASRRCSKRTGRD